MANRSKVWNMSPGETLTLAKSLRGDMASGDTLTGETPSVTVWQKQSDGTYSDVTTSASFTVASVAVNTGALTDSDGSTIAIGDGVQFRLTATQTAGSYLVRVACDTSNGDHAVSDVDLVVAGTTTP